MSRRPTVLFVLSSVEQTDAQPGGWYLPELAHPYYLLRPYCDILVASPLGGHAPLARESIAWNKDDEVSMRFVAECKHLWEETRKLDEFVGRSDVDVVFFPGGHGPMFDLATSTVCQDIIRNLHAHNRIIAAVCHGPAALIDVKLANGSYLLAGQSVTCFSNAEEAALSNTKLPWLLESVMRERIGEKGNFTAAKELLGACTVVSGGGKLITGQNPASCKGMAEAILKELGIEDGEEKDNVACMPRLNGHQK